MIENGLLNSPSMVQDSGFLWTLLAGIVEEKTISQMNVLPRKLICPILLVLISTKEEWDGLYQEGENLIWKQSMVNHSNITRRPNSGTRVRWICNRGFECCCKGGLGAKLWKQHWTCSMCGILIFQSGVQDAFYKYIHWLLGHSYFNLFNRIGHQILVLGFTVSTWLFYLFIWIKFNLTTKTVIWKRLYSTLPSQTSSQSRKYTTVSLIQIGIRKKMSDDYETQEIIISIPLPNEIHLTNPLSNGIENFINSTNHHQMILKTLLNNSTL